MSRTTRASLLSALVAGLAAILLVALRPAFAEPLAGDVIAIEHATVHVPASAPLHDATVLIVGRTIRAVGSQVTVPANARRVDARGKIVTPGFIDPATTLGVVDISNEASANDTDAHDALLQPALRWADAYNPRSVLVPIARRGGVTSALIAPTWGILGGQSAFVDLDGDTWAEAVVRPSVAMHARIDEGMAQEAGGGRGAAWMRLREALDDARFFRTRRQAYDENRSRRLSLSRVHLEALQPVLQRTLPLVVTVHRASDIEAVLRMADDFGIRVVLAGASEAWLLADELGRRKVPVILQPMENLPSRFDRLRAREDQAALLARAGVPVLFSTFSAHQVRLLWQQAGNAVRAGFDHDAAIRSVTQVPANVFGLTGYGRLAPGAVANVVVWSGDPLETSSRVERVFIRGRDVPLETRQSRLLERYRKVPVPRGP